MQNKTTATTKYVCKECGYIALKWAGRCNECGTWNSLTELKTQKSNETPIIKHKLSDTDSPNLERIKANIPEFDMTIGGGFMKGQVILLSGNPGIGKSTLLLQLADKSDQKVLYISGEETQNQISQRVKRLGLSLQKGDLVCDANLDLILTEDDYDMYIFDSIQTMYMNDTLYTKGSANYLSEVASKIINFVKTKGKMGVIIGQITKEGLVAGPKTIEHMVDTVIYLEGDENQDVRLLKVIKNRFGSTDEVGIFKITEKGIEEENDKSIFLNKNVNLIGNADTIIMEGRRPIATSIQALTSKTIFGYPKRSAQGYSLSKLNIMSAVLQKFLKMDLINQDIYLNVISGITIKDPGADLAVCASIISSYKNKHIKDKSIFIGEVGLSGEIRAVKGLPKRIKEAKALGYKNIYTLEDIQEIAKLPEILI